MSLREASFSMKFRSLLGVLLCVGVAGAQTPQPAPAAAVRPSADLAGIAHVALRVSDLGASVAFFEKLGYTKAFELSRDGKVYEAFIKINDRQFIELYPRTGKDPQVGFLHVCFEGKDLDALYAFYQQHGLTPTPVRKAGAGNLLFTMKGPATPTGPQNMEYTEYMPGSLHSRDFGNHLGPQRIADSLVAVRFAVDDPQAARTFYLEKAGFLPGSGDAVRLAGDSGEELMLGLDPERRFLCDLVLAMGDRDHARQQLTNAGLPFQAEAGGLVLQDPDGDRILLRSR